MAHTHPRSLVLALAFALAACAPAPAASTTTPTTATTPTATTGAATQTAAQTAAPVATSSTVPAGAVRFIAQSKSAATVRVEEHLAVNLINTDAVLTTEGVSGVLTLKSDGTFTPDSKIVVDMTRLHSDQTLRDRWLQLFGIETNKFKESTFVPEHATGLPAPLPQSGEWTFTLDGMLTVHGVAKPVSWKATATRAGRDLTGTATTTVHWADFGIEQPQAAVFQVVSVTDDIRLELAFVGAQSE